MSKVSRRHTLSFLLASVASIGLPSALLGTSTPILRPNFVVNRSGREIRELLKFAPVGSDITFVVCDTETGEELESFNPLRSLPPASVMKAITGFYALETLGPEFSFQTRLMTNGSINNGVLEGDLILFGGGDPTLDTDALYYLSKLLS
jgi:D-alanyl-D-alanine carboxypeptidase/D-alanyl-D-alanine-endopeptidase (penicillin-binding protein 4)